MFKFNVLFAALLSLALVGCGSEKSNSSGDGGGGNAGSSDLFKVGNGQVTMNNIIGVWESSPQVGQGGATAVSRFQFTADSITAAVKCTHKGNTVFVEGSSSAVVNTQTIKITNAIKKEQVLKVGEDQITCSLSVPQGTFPYTLNNGRITIAGQTIADKKVRD